MSFRIKVREEMEYRGLTAKDLAAQAGISVNTLNMYLGYRESIPSADIAVRIANVLGCTVESLFDNNTSQLPDNTALEAAQPEPTFTVISRKDALRRKIDSELDALTENELHICSSLISSIRDSREYIKK